MIISQQKEIMKTIKTYQTKQYTQGGTPQCKLGMLSCKDLTTI
jgi:hypothetical protein